MQRRRNESDHRASGRRAKSSDNKVAPQHPQYLREKLILAKAKIPELIRERNQAEAEVQNKRLVYLKWEDLQDCEESAEIALRSYRTWQSHYDRLGKLIERWMKIAQELEEKTGDKKRNRGEQGPSNNEES